MFCMLAISTNNNKMKHTNQDSVYTNTVTKSETLGFRIPVPSDLHWIPEGKFIGEIYDEKEDKYYSAAAGKKYRPKHDEKHLDEGHFQGYRYAIHHLTKEGDNIFDPTVGSATAIIEAINNKRNGYGIELEWPELATINCDYQQSKMKWGVFKGNAKDLLKIVPPELKFKLILNGTPYPVLFGKDGGISSDSPATNTGGIKNYTAEGSFGLLAYPKGGYEKFIRQMYKDCYELLEEDGMICLIIKDPIRNKKPFLLQKLIIDWIKEDTGMEQIAWFCHRHAPDTYFMRTYSKRFPEVNIPKYQIGIILKK